MGPPNTLNPEAEQEYLPDTSGGVKHSQLFKDEETIAERILNICIS
jgi:hypothetical protein